MDSSELSSIIVDAEAVAKPDDTVGRVISRMKEHKAHIACVVDDLGKLVGVVSYRDLLDRRVSPRSKISSVMAPPYSISVNSSINDAVEKILGLRTKAVPVVDGSGKLSGLVTRESLLRYLLDVGQIPNARVSSVMSTPVIWVRGSDPVATARWLMIRHGISKLPVIDDGRLSGIVSLRDIAERLYYASIPYRSRRGDVAGDEVEILAAPVKGIASYPVVTVDSSSSLASVAELIIRTRYSGFPVISDGQVVGMVSGYDIIRRSVERIEVVPIDAKISGIDDESVRRSIDRVIGAYLAKISKITDPIDVKVVIKNYRSAKTKDSEKRIKYSVHIMLKDSNDIYKVNETEWDPINAVRYAMETLLKRIERATRKRAEKYKRSLVRAKRRDRYLE